MLGPRSQASPRVSCELVEDWGSVSFLSVFLGLRVCLAEQVLGQRANE